MYLDKLWTTFRKHQQVVDGRNITYICVPKLLLTGGKDSKTFFVDAMRLVHRPTNQLMIFISKKELPTPALKYTLLHEHMEGLFELGDKNFLNEHKEKFKEIVSVLERRFPDIIEELKKATQDKSHLFALIFEIDFAMREMDEAELKVFFDDIIKNRL